jgi:hypothetical protein
VSIGSGDYPANLSIHTLIRDQVAPTLTSLNTVKLSNSVLGNLNIEAQPSFAVSIVSVKQQPSFLARTVSATNTSQNLTVFNGGAGYTCSNGVRIKTSRIATGAAASQNEIMCVISEADASVYGASAGAASYVLYHGDEMMFEVDNINKIKVFYPAYSESFAPHNTGNGITFSFYAS